MADNKKLLTETATTTVDAATQWKGYTLDELRMARAKALLRREFGRQQLQSDLQNVGTRAKEQGVRGLLFSNNVVGKLNKVDYMYLVFRAARLLTRLWLKKRK